MHQHRGYGKVPKENRCDFEYVGQAFCYPCCWHKRKGNKYNYCIVKAIFILSSSIYNNLLGL